MNNSGIIKYMILIYSNLQPVNVIDVIHLDIDTLVLPSRHK